ncbi:MAG: hypothetical protein HY985_19455 [Magnetospirillum sp.]|nr:hypothetical protein [Magnetospirillum sp.]
MELTHHSRVAVIGGGPAGSLTAYFMLDLANRLGIHLNVDIFDAAQFTVPGPKGCNHCGGIISETLVQMLSMEGINLPPEVVQRGIDSYALHTDQGSASIRTPLAEMRIAALYRGSGPLDRIKKGTDDSGDETVAYRSFDGFLQSLAVEKGARVINTKVTSVTRTGSLPVVAAKDMEDRSYDLVVGAVGVNGAGLKIFDPSAIAFKPPKTTKAVVTEIYLGRQELAKHFGNTMHVVLARIPRVSFAAIIPKGEYVTVVMLGKELDRDTITTFLSHPTVRARFPDWIDLGARSCYCRPDVSLGMASPVCADRVVLVGDAAVSRLYKDGNGAAYKTAKALATAAVIHGVSRDSFERYYVPTCRKLDVDNTIGKSVFLTVDLFKWLPMLSRGMLGMVRGEQTPQAGGRMAMSMVLWDTFTGSNSYRSILRRCLNPMFLARLTMESLRSLRARPAAGEGEAR